MEVLKSPFQKNPCKLPHLTLKPLHLVPELPHHSCDILVNFFFLFGGSFMRYVGWL